MARSFKYAFHIYYKGPYSTIVHGWLPEGREEIGNNLDKLARSTCKHLAWLDHVGWRDGIGQGDLAYEGHFSDFKEAKHFCQMANRKVAKLLKS